MSKKYFDHIIHGGDYNPDQWIKTPEIWDEDMRLMKLAHINSATINIFSWSLLEPEEGVYNFEWLDNIMDKLHTNGISVILATPSGARPPWLAQKYPEVLRVEENGIRNEFGVRHNHCLTSPVYREKVRKINRMIAQRYKDHPALKMWHISNEYSGECHCELCQEAFRDWLKEYYHNDLEELNDKWWNGFWSHRITDWSQINSPKYRGENHVSAMKLCWNRFVSDSHISFYENEIAPLREITPDIPITTNFMRMYDGIDYQKFAKHLDLVSWDNYPGWDKGRNPEEALQTAFVHDAFRSMRNGQPFFMMESTPSLVNWHDVNKLPKPGMQELSAIQAIAHGADSVQYFQWRKSRGGHEKFHGAVVDHCGHENTRVFRDVSRLGSVLEKLDGVVGKYCNSKIAIIYDWENSWAVKHFCGYNNQNRNYLDECIKWYAPFWRKGISADIISMEDDFSKYDIVIAPFLYMLKDNTAERIEEYVKNGGNFVATYLTGIVDKDDMCFLGGFPADRLKNVFGIWCEETDSLPKGMSNKATFNGKAYDVVHICDIIHSTGAKVLGEYQQDFYAGMPAVTENSFGKGKAYYVAFRNDNDFSEDFCSQLINIYNIEQDSDITSQDGIAVRKRGEYVFVMNFSDSDKTINLNRRYLDIVNDKETDDKITLPSCGYLILK
ncbi:MAG: beta-galactosidase [Clostridia bacterium]|nr:beta-galactosidase [Clostridia bacterium]MBQ7046573.1 beta-galactosidase [Oscillospiraceae bacterium]